MMQIRHWGWHLWMLTFTIVVRNEEWVLFMQHSNLERTTNLTCSNLF